ncbi:hypothetical protein [Amycolatopsis sp. NPDC051071]|uniref:hypothetical protein n=1 Tax=Amycolatopsis sp. NPDC051071 TaxID=3154637 RepID=UPI003432825E
MPTNAAGTGFWTAQTRNNALQGRTLLQGLYLATNVGGANPVPLSANRTGVICTSDFGADIFDLRVTVTSGLTMSVKPGTAIVHRDGVGPYEGWLRPGAVSVTCDAAPVSNSRNDIVCLRIYDVAQGDTVPGTGPVQIEVITGTPGAVPVDPVNVSGTISSWPASGGGVGIALARARVSTSGVITLTDVRRSTGVLGAVRPMLPGDLSADGSNCQGDLRWNPALGTIQLYNASGSWQRIRSGEDVGGEWRDARTTPPINLGSTKLQFATNAVSANGLTYNGTDTWTVQTDGIYNVFCQLRATSAQNGGIAMGSTTYADGTHILPFLGFTPGPDYGLSGPVKLTAGQQFCFYFYNNGSNTTINNALRNAMVKIWKQNGAP